MQCCSFYCSFPQNVHFYYVSCKFPLKTSLQQIPCLSSSNLPCFSPSPFFLFSILFNVLNEFGLFGSCTIPNAKMAPNIVPKIAPELSWAVTGLGGCTQRPPAVAGARPLGAAVPQGPPPLRLLLPRTPSGPSSLRLVRPPPFWVMRWVPICW